MSQYFVFDLLVEQCTIMVEFISTFQSLNYFVRHRTNSRQFHPVASGSEYNYMNGFAELRRALYVTPASPFYTHLPQIFVGNFHVLVLPLLVIIMFEYCQIIHFRSS